MKYAYPQDPTSAISSIRRVDERSDSSTQQSSLERQQDIAVVGETVPLIYGHRFDWGGTLGVNGGVWLSPRLIQLGIDGSALSMMYLISQGDVKGLKEENTYWGYQKLKAVDDSGLMCFAYEQTPACLNLDYDPGGSLTWDTTVSSNGPRLGGSEGEFVTNENCRKVTFNFNASISVSGSGTIVGGFSGSASLQWNKVSAWPASAGGTTISSSGNGGGRWALWNTGGYTSSYNYYGTETRTWNFSNKRKSASWYQTSEVRYDWAAIDLNTNLVVKSGQIWIQHGTSSLTIEFPPAQYKIVFNNKYSERNASYSQYTIPNPGDNGYSWSSYWNSASYTSGPGGGFRRRTTVGSLTESVDNAATQVIYNELVFADIPGGDQQLVGGLSDLTMLGINGDLLKLRPTEGPNYFLQAHIFVEDGIDVERLTLSGIGPSPFYGDLINYLLERSSILQAEQIDKNSLIVANQMHEKYNMYFNGVLQVTTSFVEWLTRTAPYFLMMPRQINGRYGISPVCPLNADFELSRDAIIPALTITKDDIAADSYTRQYIDPKTRRPICLIMIYRDQPLASVGQTVTVEVRYPGTALDGPFETHDLTDFCCRPEQAVLAARYILAKRRYTTHQVEFSMNRRSAQLAPGEIIKIDMATETSDGTGIDDSFFYQIDSLTEGQDGSVAVMATHYPADSTGISLIALDTHQGSVSIT